MKRASHALPIKAIVAFFLFSASLLGQDSEQAVKAAFDGYKTAIMNDRGAEAVGYLSSSTVRYYEEMRDLALYAAEADVRKQSTINLLQVLSMRHRVPVGELQSLSGTSLLVYAVDHGWIGKNSVAPLNVTRVDVVGDTAVVSVGSAARAGVVQARFVRESGQWRFELTSLMELTSAAIDLLAIQQRITREQLIFTMLSAVSGQQVTDSIWRPLVSTRR